MRKIKMMVGMVIPLLGLASCGGNPTSQTPVENLKDAAIIVNTARIAYDDGSEEKLYHADLAYARSFKFAPQADGIATKVMIRPGQKVSEGQALIAYPVQNYQLQVEQQHTIYKDMLSKLEKQKVLLAKGFVARQAVEEQSQRNTYTGRTIRGESSVRGHYHRCVYQRRRPRCIWYTTFYFV